MSLPLGYHDLMDALPRRGCAVCRLTQAGVSSFLDGLLYEYVNTPPVHRDFRAGRGLCDRHMWQLPDYRGVSLGVAILDAAVLDELIQIVDASEASRDTDSGLGRWRRRRETSPSALADALEPTGPCIACAEAERVEARTLRTFTSHYDQFAAPFGASDGLCLPHFRLALRQPMPAATSSALAAAQRAIWQRLIDELHEFQRKSDINHAGDPMGSEGDSWVRAIARIAGERDSLPDRSRVR